MFNKGYVSARSMASVTQMEVQVRCLTTRVYNTQGTPIVLNVTYNNETLSSHLMPGVDTDQKC